MRRLLVVGAAAMPRFALQHGGGGWITGMTAWKRPRVAAVANRSARIAWALMAGGEIFTPRPA